MPAKNTYRAKLRYTVAGKTHFMLFRFTEAEAAGDPLAHIEAFATAMAPVCLNDTVFVDLQQAEKNVVPFTPAYALGTVGEINEARSVNYPPSFYAQVTGRGTGLSQVSWYMYGLPISLNRPMRWSTGLVTAYTVFWGALSAIPGLASIDGSEAVLRPYINVGFNDYLTNKERD